MRSFTLFCDESGNTGPQFDSVDQPLYTEGGWLVDDRNQAALEELFLSLESRHRFTAKTKATRLKDSPAGRACLLEVIEALAERATPFYYVVEKRYFICAKAVATYFDPNYNPLIDETEAHDPDRRKARAEALYAAPQDVISGFARAFRNRDPLGLRAVGELWASALGAHGHAGLAVQLRHALPGIEANMRAEFTNLAAHFPRGYDTLNAPAVAQVCQLLEQYAVPSRIIHDQCGPHEAIYRHLFNFCRDAPHSVLRRPDGSIDVRGFQFLRDLEFGDSEVMPLLRAADYLLASCGDFLRRAGAGEDIPCETRSAAHHGLGRMLCLAVGRPVPAGRTRRQIGEIMASDVWIEKMAACFHTTG